LRYEAEKKSCREWGREEKHSKIPRASFAAAQRKQSECFALHDLSSHKLNITQGSPLLYASGAFTKLIDVFITFTNKESVLYISILEYTSDACSERNIAFRVETIHNEFKSLTKFSSLLKAPENFSVFCCGL